MNHNLLLPITSSAKESLRPLSRESQQTENSIVRPLPIIQEPSVRAKSPNKNQLTRNPEDSQRIATYVLKLNGQTIYHKLDFNSPRTREAAGQIGISYDDCVLKYFKLII